ncbi:ribonuclease H2, subunit B, partial [Cantharellus anzutake]|uniref:ribonuclease H2, subunit B n=1 Tax=Cantharellus anzutake TaxID=1750568 RepID=UPI0019043AB2
RFLHLPHPRTGIPSLFLPTESPDNENLEGSQSRILEVQCVSPDVQRSWFIDNHVESNGELLLFTPIDPAFLLIPFLRAAFPIVYAGLEHRFRTLDDILEEAANRLYPPDSLVQSSPSQSNENSKQNTQSIAADITSLSSLPCIRTAFNRACETKQIAEDVVMYKYSERKLLDLLQAKVGKLVDPRTFGAFPSFSRPLARLGLYKEQENGRANGQQLESVAALARLKVACDAVSQYLSPDLSQILRDSYDLQELDKYVAKLAAEESPSLEQTINNKKKASAPNTKANPKEVKKAKGSRGVEALKKVDTSGMNKLSKFFKKE